MILEWAVCRNPEGPSDFDVVGGVNILEDWGENVLVEFTYPFRVLWLNKRQMMVSKSLLKQNVSVPDFPVDEDI